MKAFALAVTVLISAPALAADPGKGPLAKKISRRHNPNRGLFAGLGNDREFHLARLQIKNRICWSSLGEDGLLLRKEHGFPALTDRG